jgi:hypothetical protein
VLAVTDNDTKESEHGEDGRDHTQGGQSRPIDRLVAAFLMTLRESRARKPTAATTGPTSETCDQHNGPYMYAVSLKDYQD